mmetsp:Transcript_35427/g.34466  ORF Transcript_35427/g.34466 Transcript_35427/m.34466 type:complete len:91 (+) Transcript_35427:25-297(+)
MSITEKGSQSANEYARKKREQIEKAKQLREERKSGRALQNAGEQFIKKSGSIDIHQYNGSENQINSNYSQQKVRPGMGSVTQSTTSTNGF